MVTGLLWACPVVAHAQLNEAGAEDGPSSKPADGAAEEASDASAPATEGEGVDGASAEDPPDESESGGDPSAPEVAPLDEGRVIDLDELPDEGEGAAPPGGSGMVIDRENEAWDSATDDPEEGAADEPPRGWVYPVVGLHLDVTAPLATTRTFTPSVGGEIEGQLGITPFLHLGGAFRIGYGGLSTRVLGSSIDDDTPERIAIVIGPRARLTSPVLWGLVTGFFDFTFGYQYLTVAVDDNAPEDCTIDVFGDETCTGGPTVLDRASRDGHSVGLGGGLAFETHAAGEGDNWPEGEESLKLVVRATYLLNEWYARTLRNRNGDQVRVSLGVLFW